MVYVFEAVDNPHPDALAAINADLVIPTGYQGLNRDPFLAAIFNQLVTTGRATDVQQLATRATGNTYTAARLEKLDGFLAVATRFDIANPEFLYFNFAHVLDMEEHANWYYVLFLAVYYHERVINLATTLMQLIEAETDQERKRLDINRINAFIDTNVYLRQEGVVRPLGEVYAFSKLWSKEDAYLLLTHKVGLDEANKFARAGFEDAATIVHSKRVIPASMIDDLINPKPLPVDDDDDDF